MFSIFTHVTHTVSLGYLWRDRKSAWRRLVIHKAMTPHPADSTIQPYAPLSQQIAFAKLVVLPKPTDPKTE